MTSTRQNLINGQWVGSSDVGKNINPADTADLIFDYARATADDTTSAIDAANNAFQSWSRAGIQARFDILDAVGNEILRRKDELGTLLAREEGKSLPESIGETVRAAQIFKFFAAEAVRLSGESGLSVRDGIDIDIVREPVGTIGIIAPWNFPIAIPAWKIAPALAYGNCVVFKPAELVPGSAHALAEILVNAGIPDGVFNLLIGSGHTVGETIVNSPGIDAISFTGSVDVGRSIAVSAVASGKKIQLEMGGKNPMIVLDDADLDVAVSCAINSAFFSTGQRCTASSRLIVTEGVYWKFCQSMKTAMRELKVGNPLDPQTNIGPAAYHGQMMQDLEYVEVGKQEGATLIGGEQLSGNGFFVAPALFTESSNDMRISREEIFGPVASVIKAKDFDHALELANDTEFGLSAGICTTSLAHARHFKKTIQAGMAMVNLPTAGVDYHVPFGGTKNSSYGPREQGSYAKEFYTKVKTCYVA